MITNSTRHISFNGEIKDNDECLELMQYTGLKDKNGVEIYENDIIKCVGGTAKSDKTTTGIVLMKYYMWGVVNTKFAYHSFNDLLDKNNSFEVIDNIYENKEMLDV